MTQSSSPIDPVAREAARILLDTKSVLINTREPFTYTSGKTGPVYVDCRRLISFPAARGRLMDMQADAIRKHCPGAAFVAGGETAGIPYAAFLAERLNLPMLYVRKKPKGFGRMAQIEGFMEKAGAEVALVEDVQNFGVSVKVFVDALRDAEAVVGHIFVIFQHGHESSRKNMEEMGVTLHALTSWREVLAVAREDGDFDIDTLESARAYLRDPAAWQKAG
jgi:orotate phosphoribosyltransferase